MQIAAELIIMTQVTYRMFGIKVKILQALYFARITNRSSMEDCSRYNKCR